MMIELGSYIKLGIIFSQGKMEEKLMLHIATHLNGWL
jgi:hypothetical protein